MDSIRECGFPALLMLFGGGLGLAVGTVALVVAFASKSRTTSLALSSVALFVALGTLALGPLGMMWGRLQTDRALEAAEGMLSEGDKVRLRAQGNRESASCVTDALAIGTVPTLLAGVALVLALRKKRAP